MDAAKLERRAEEHFKSTFSDPVWRRRSNDVIEKSVRPADPAAVGRARLGRLLAHACDTVPEYHPLSAASRKCADPRQALSEWPFATKHDFRSRMGDFVSTRYDKGQVQVRCTSGSTRKPTPHLECLDDEFVTGRALQVRLFRDHGLARNWSTLDLAPRQHRHGQPVDPLVAYDVGLDSHLTYRLRRFDRTSAASVEEYCRFAARPFDVLFGAPSRLQGLADYVDHSGWRLSFEVVVSSFEGLHQSARDAFADRFGCQVVDLYGTSETGFVGWECREGRLHVEEDLSLVEVLDSDGGPVGDGKTGRLVITSLQSWLMPVIRYDTGDLGAVTHLSCACGRTTPVITRLEGRVSTTFVSRLGERVGPATLLNQLDRLGVVSFQVVQARPGELVVNLGPRGSSATHAVMEHLRASRLPFEFEVVSRDFQAGPGSKFHACLSLIDE